MPVLQPMLMALMGPLQVPLANIIARIMVPLCQASFGKQMAEQIDPSLAAAPAPSPAQPQAPAPAAPQARPAPAAAVEEPQASSGNGKPAAATAPNGSRAKAGKAQRDQEQDGQAAASRARTAAGAPTGDPGDPQAELQRMLELVQQLLGPDAAAGPDPLQLDHDLDPAADWKR